MKKIWLTLAGLMVIGAVLLTGCADGGAISGIPETVKLSLNSQSEGIWVNGTGKVAVVPDTAVISLGVEAQADTVADAQAQAATAMEAVMDTLMASGVDKDDIKTTYFNIQRQTRWDKDNTQEVVIGYRVTNTVTAKVRDVEKAGPVIDNVAAAAGDLIRINGISFEVADPTEYNEQAREIAMKEAKAKAEQMAELSGVILGDSTYITENSYYPAPVYREYAAAPVAISGGADMSISAGEQEITIQVQVVYNIQN
ncbi:SIMPL domain-containing protein [Chloroflexota bacterium]